MAALCQPSMALDGQGRDRAAGDVALAGSPLAPAPAPGTGASLLCGLMLVKERKQNCQVGFWHPFPFPCQRWSEHCLCEGHQGIFSMGEESQSVKSMGKCASCSCRRTCLGLLVLLERLICLKTQQGEESTTSFPHSLGEKVAVSCSSPSHESGRS